MRAEDALQASVATYLDMALPRASWWTATANGAHLAGDAAARAKQVARMKRTGIKAGCPDIIVVCDGRFFGIEIKSAKGRLSDAQKAVAETIVAAGGGYTVARSIDDIDAFLREMRVPLRTHGARSVGELIQPIMADIAQRVERAA